jgi:hypothetical protein|tara:strand:+ start:153 stop:455 length:303 start_codon:yes stop_codon:yes gene_type:complete
MIAIPGKRYIIIVNLFLELSLFSFFSIHADSEQTAGSLSIEIGDQQTTQWRCGSIAIELFALFLFSSCLRFEAASLASCAVLLAALAILSVLLKDSRPFN